MPRRTPRLLCTVFTLLVISCARFAAGQEIVVRAAAAVPVGTAWRLVADPTAAGGTRLANADAAAAKLNAPLAAPLSYVEVSFDVTAGVPYRLWLRMKAERNSWANDSVFVQFSNSVGSTGGAVWRIGTTSAATVSLEDCIGCGVSGWGWQDTGMTGLGPLVTFASGGTQRLRIQVREDGASIDQIVLSRSTWLTDAPGAPRDDTTVLEEGTTPPAAPLVREPYLQSMTDQSAVIVWASVEHGPAEARVGGATVTATSRLVPASESGLPVDSYQHEAPVGGLTPATTYGYTLFVNGRQATAGSDRFTTAPAPGTGHVRFVAFGDSGTGSSAQRTLAALMRDEPFDLALHAGDIAYGNTGGTGDASYARYQSWFFDIYRDWLRRAPLFPAMGNHDSRPTTGWGRAYLDLFVLPPAGGSAAYPDHAERFYSVDYGPVHLIVLDTELAFQDPARRADQLAWLERDLAGTDQPWKIVTLHRAPFSAGGEHGSDTSVRAAFVPLFEQYGVQLVIAAHEHDYERSVPWRQGTDTTRQAVTYVVTGGGGAPLYSAGLASWTAASRSAYHYVRGDVDGCHLTLDAVGTTGVVFDRLLLDRCLQAADAAAPTVTVATPAAGATVTGSVTVAADAIDDTRVEKVDFLVDGVLQAVDLTTPYRFTWDSSAVGAGAHTLVLRATDLDGRRAERSIAVIVAASASAAPEVVVHAADVPAASVHGDWVKVGDTSAAAAIRLATPNRGAPKLIAAAAPVSYVDVTVDVIAGVPYHLWLRLRAEGNSWANDSVFVQFTGSVDAAGVPIVRRGTTAAANVTLEEGVGAGVHGWGWNDQASGGMAAPIYFAATGPQTMRIQVREDGASFDQVVLSPGRFLASSPGALTDDTAIITP